MGTNQLTRPRTRRLAIVLATATVLATGASLPTAYATGGETNDGRGNRLAANLTGAKEVPGPGDPDGRGKARIQLEKDQICFELSWRKIDAPTAAHIHVGSREEAGPVVVGLLNVLAPGLAAPVSSVGGCASADPALIADIRRHPSAYYVNIHNVFFPAGAIRGQLHR
jgi:CHRD domain-containing protein